MKKALLVTAALLALSGAAHSQSATPEDDVMELAIRSIPDQEAWMAAAAPLAEAAAGVTGIIAGAEFMSVMGFAPVDANGKPVQNVFVGISQYDNQEVYDGLAATYYGEDVPPVFAAYLETIDTIANVGNLRPFRDTPAIDVANMVKPGQVLEIAVRDVSGIDFDAFDAKRAAFVSVLTAQSGVLGEYEYRSIDGKYYVGMTLYESDKAVQAISTNPAVSQGPEFGVLMAEFPPMVSQFLVRIH